MSADPDSDSIRSQVRNDRWSWRNGLRGQIINTDIDGLLTACLLHHVKGWPIIGMYDTKRLWVNQEVDEPLDMQSTIWVDVDMCWPSALSLSQHVVTTTAGDAESVHAFRDTINPSLAFGHAQDSTYGTKYPFGTFQWAWWLIEKCPATFDPDDDLATGLAWMPDGGFQSVMNRHRANCLNWATEILRGSVLTPLARLDGGQSARRKVEAARTYLQQKSGFDDRFWRNEQFVLSAHDGRSGPNPKARPADVTTQLQALLNAICAVFGWTPPTMPNLDREYIGTWRTGTQPPAGWPESANNREVVSIAATGFSQLCWTTPETTLPGRPLAEILPKSPRFDYHNSVNLEVEYAPEELTAQPENNFSRVEERN